MSSNWNIGYASGPVDNAFAFSSVMKSAKVVLRITKLLRSSY